MKDLLAAQVINGPVSVELGFLNGNSNSHKCPSSEHSLLFDSGNQTQKDNNDGIVNATHGNLTDPFINKDGITQW